MYFSPSLNTSVTYLFTYLLMQVSSLGRYLVQVSRQVNLTYMHVSYLHVSSLGRTYLPTYLGSYVFLTQVNRLNLHVNLLRPTNLLAQFNLFSCKMLPMTKKQPQTLVVNLSFSSSVKKLQHVLRSRLLINSCYCTNMVSSLNLTPYCKTCMWVLLCRIIA